MQMKFIAVAVCLFTGSLFAQEKARVFVTDKQVVGDIGSFRCSGSGFGGETHGGARPQTAEIIKTFGEKCGNVTVTMKQEKANYVVVLEHEGGKSWIRKDNKVAVFNQDGDSIVSHSTMSLADRWMMHAKPLIRIGRKKEWRARCRKRSSDGGRIAGRDSDGRT